MKAATRTYQSAFLSRRPTCQIAYRQCRLTVAPPWRQLTGFMGGDVAGEEAWIESYQPRKSLYSLRSSSVSAARQTTITRQRLDTPCSRIPIVDHVMPSSEAAPLVFYPAYCFPSSPTYFAWVKLTAHDIRHLLRSRPGFAASTTSSKSELLFYLNHPVQFVQVTGVIVAYDDYYEKFWSFTVDDGSGEVVECVCWKPDKGQVNAGQGDGGKSAKIEVEQEKREGVIKGVDIGTVVQVKGTVNTFREVRQIQIERLNIVPTTNHEVKSIAARTKFYEEVLLKPWVVSPNRQKRLLKDAQGEKQKESQKAMKLRERQKKLEEREKRHAERIAREYEADEEQRRKDAVDARQAGMDLQQQKSRQVVSDDFAELAY